MSSATPAELSASAIIQQIDADAYPRELVLNFARGFLPLEQEDVVAVLAHLSLSDDADIASTARAALAEMPARTLIAIASNEAANSDHLAKLARATTEGSILEALIRNRALTDEAVADLARVAEPAVQDVIVINQARILRAPSILDALLENPRLTPDTRRRVLENREEFFDKKERARLALAAMAEFQEPDLIDAPMDPIADLIEAAEKIPDSEVAAPIPLPLITDEKEKSIWAKIQKMTVAQKVMLAFRGDKTVRMIMVRERNKMVCAAAMRNPRMTEGEAESIAGMRNVEEEVLRLVGTRRDWMQKYGIINQLIHNPRAPIAIVLPLINRLTLRDLKGLKDDRGVAEVVRSTAKKFYVAKMQKS
jgi:F0F1-type ATP synthase delta subunit